MNDEPPKKRARGNDERSPPPAAREKEPWNGAGAVVKARDPLELHTRLSFRKYVQYMQEHALASFDTDEAWSDAYQAYRREHKLRQLWSFFLAHVDEAWFREKYDPDAELHEQRAERRRAGLGDVSDWIRELEQGQLDAACMDLIEEHAQDRPLYTVTSRSGVREHFDAEALPIPPDTEHTLLVRAWPSDLPRSALEAHLRTFPGFRYVAMLEPMAQRHWQRTGIAVFEPDVDVRAALSALDGRRFGTFQLHLAMVDRPSNGRVRFAPAVTQTAERLTHDAEQARRLVRHWAGDDAALCAIDARLAHLGLDVHHAEEDVRRDSVRRRLMQRKKQLDWTLDLLRTVYHCDYYLGLQCDFAEELERRSFFHVRRPWPASDDQQDAAWCGHLDAKIALLLDPATASVPLGRIDKDR